MDTIGESGPFRDIAEAVELLTRILELTREVNGILFQHEDPACLTGPFPAPPEGSLGEKMLTQLVSARRLYGERLDLTARSSPGFPLVAVAEQHRMTDIERRIFEAVLAFSCDTSTPFKTSITVGSVSRFVANWDSGETRRLLRFFLPDAKLVKAGLLDISRCRPEVENWAVRILGKNLSALLQDCRPPRPSSSPGRPEQPVVKDLLQFLSGRGVFLNDTTAASLRTMWNGLAYAKRISQMWQFPQDRLPSRFCALFHGPSGTGKSLTARHVCSALRREALVVTPADIESHYVGMAEKRVVNLFREATGQDRPIVFEEADSLFARRGEVVRAADRYCNSLASTLLIALERFDGVVLLTTNHPDLLDSAFSRRIRHKVEFGLPDGQTRSRIWRALMPATAPLAGVDFDALGRRFELTGGEIANAVMNAATAAIARLVGDEDGGIEMGDLEAAARQELFGCRREGTRSKVGF